MRILVTGASGFLGKILVKELTIKNDVFTLSRSRMSDIQSDLTKYVPELPNIDLVVHAAGKAHHIPKTSEEKEEFYKVNCHGTKLLLHRLEEKLPETLIYISTVAVYGKEKGDMIDENAPLLGTSSYAKSKIKAERDIQKWGRENGVNTVILRLPLIAGPNPPGNLGSLIKAIKKGYYFRIGEGKNRKSVVLAKDIGLIIPRLISKEGIYHLTDGRHPEISELDTYIANELSRNIKVLPYKFARYIAMIGDRISSFPLNTSKFGKLTNSLTFSDKKAQDELGWSPRKVVSNFKII